MDEFGPAPVETNLEKALIFTTLAFAAIGGWWKLTEKKSAGRSR